MYKDKDKQREANKEAAKRYRQRKQGMTQGVMSQGMTQPLTMADVKALTPAQAKAVLQDWAAGKDTDYQDSLGRLARCYGGEA
jgi:hypothetical protein